MKKILHVAARDFLATVTTKGFILALVVPPVFYAAVAVIFPRVMSSRLPAESGAIAIVDPGGDVAGSVKTYLTPEAIAERRRAALGRIRAATGSTPRMIVPEQALESVAGSVPHLEVVNVPVTADLAEEKRLLRTGGGPARRVALVVVRPDTVIPQARDQFGTFDLFVRAGLDDRIQREILNGMDNAIVAARARREGLDPAHVNALTTVKYPQAITVTDTEQGEGASAFTRFVPAAFAILLLISVM